MPPSLFHRANALYEPGDRILPGNWGRLVMGFGPNHNLFYREYLWERIRRTEFDGLPSRMRAAFAFEDAEYAKTFVQESNRPTYTYLVRPREANAPAHRVDMTWLEAVREYRTFEDVEACVRHYWAGDDRTERVWEWVIAGELEIVQRLTAIARDEASTGA